MEIAVIYWSGTGNTKMMAEAVAEGIAEAGAQAVVKSVSEITPKLLQKKQLLMIKLLLAAVPWAPKYWKKPNLNPSLPWLKII